MKSNGEAGAGREVSRVREGSSRECSYDEEEFTDIDWKPSNDDGGADDDGDTDDDGDAGDDGDADDDVDADDDGDTGVEGDTADNVDTDDEKNSEGGTDRRDNEA